MFFKSLEQLDILAVEFLFNIFLNEINHFIKGEVIF